MWTPGCQHLDDNSKVVTLLFPKLHGICLDLIWQTQVPLQLPDVGTSMPQGKSGHPPPAGTWCCGETDRVSPALWPHRPGCIRPGKKPHVWASVQEGSDHLPQGSRLSYRRDKLERRDGTEYLLMPFPHLHIHHSFYHSFVQDQRPGMPRPWDKKMTGPSPAPGSVPPSPESVSTSVGSVSVC